MTEDFEAQLRKALRRQDPTPGFAERVIARTQAPKRRSGWRTWAAAAAAVVLVATPLLYQHRQQQKAEQARDQAILALQITAEKLNVLRDKIRVTEGETQ